MKSQNRGHPSRHARRRRLASVRMCPGFPRFKPQDTSPVLLQEHTSSESLPAAEMTRDITKHTLPVTYASVLCQAQCPCYRHNILVLHDLWIHHLAHLVRAPVQGTRMVAFASA